MNFKPAEEFIAGRLAGICRTRGLPERSIILEIPKQPGHGDLSSNVALTAAKQLGVNPRELAQQFAAEFPAEPGMLERVEVAGPGFLNFHLAADYFRSLLKSLNADPDGFGASNEGGGRHWLFEFVSANPTGPLNVVSARAASVGDTLVRVFRKRGFVATAEYYVNDGGGQVRNLGASLKARASQLQGGDAAIPEGGYHGEYVRDLARAWLGNQDGTGGDDLKVGRWAAERIRDDQERVLELFRVRFDRWFRESELYDAGRVDTALRALAEPGNTYEKGGAVWFRASKFGDSDDRVVRTSDGRHTYVVPDIAYHQDKFDRGNEVAVTILGPDHHGHIAQLGAALRAVGLPEGFYRPLMIQQVNLKRGGEEVKMSKRAGVGITLEELIGEVGVDAARFFFLMRRSSSHLDFDIDLAKRHSDENPVYYVQYAHARICSILRQPDAFNPGTDADLSLLSQLEELNLLKALARFPWTLSAVVRGLEPHPITVHLMELARSFHLFYQRHRVIGPDRALTAARLSLCRGVAAVLKSGLNLMGVEAPERM